MYRFRFPGLARQLVLACVVGRNNGPRGTMIRICDYAVWDTGSSQTSIRKDIAEALEAKLEYDKDDEGSGCIIGRKVFPKTNISLRVCDQKARRLRVNVIDSDEMPDVLIGMDYISQGRFTVEKVGDEIEVTFELV